MVLAYLCIAAAKGLQQSPIVPRRRGIGTNRLKSVL
jgi:hypothetical protein